MSQLRNLTYLRSTSIATTKAVRISNYWKWQALWEHYGACHTCHQPAGRPCLDLGPVSDVLYSRKPHKERPSISGSTIL